MIKQFKRITIQMITGANVATVIIMLLVGYSDRVYPIDHPMISTIGMTFPFFLLANLLFLFFWLTFKWKKMWIPIAGFLLAYVPISIYMPFHLKQEVPEGSVKIISYNVCGYGGDNKYENGAETILDYLRHEKPDIVCIQEDNDSWRANMFEEYSKTLPHNDTIVLHNSSLGLNAIGIHTRYPIIKRERIDYPSKTNGSVAWWLKIGNDTVIVINNHFESCHLNTKDREQYRQILKGEMTRDSVKAESKLLLTKLTEANAKRAKQIDIVCEYVKEHNNYPIIVCGDFNDNPLSYSRYMMSQQLTDCFVKTGKGVGLSYNRKAFWFRIDHIFCSSDIEPFNCIIDSKMDASDHYPVLCWLKIGRNH